MLGYSLDGGRILNLEVFDLYPLIIGGYKFPVGTKVSLNQEKVLSTTKINGLNGTIKEISGFDDWHITIEYFFIPALPVGIAARASHLMMLDELDSLHDVWKEVESLEVINLKLNYLGISKMVLTRFEIPHPDREFELNVRIEGLSDNEIDLEV